jgi:hypothetical protein
VRAPWRPFIGATRFPLHLLFLLLRNARVGWETCRCVKICNQIIFRYHTTAVKSWSNHGNWFLEGSLSVIRHGGIAFPGLMGPDTVRSG